MSSLRRIWSIACTAGGSAPRPSTGPLSRCCAVPPKSPAERYCLRKCSRKVAQRDRGQSLLPPNRLSSAGQMRVLQAFADHPPHHIYPQTRCRVGALKSIEWSISRKWKVIELLMIYFEKETFGLHSGVDKSKSPSVPRMELEGPPEEKNRSSLRRLTMTR